MIYLTLFLTFLKIGAVSFGGGYGMISLIRETVLENAWLTEEEFLNFIAVAESTPGRSPSIWRPSSAPRRQDFGGAHRDAGRHSPLLCHHPHHRGAHQKPSEIRRRQKRAFGHPPHHRRAHFGDRLHDVCNASFRLHVGGRRLHLRLARPFDLSHRRRRRRPLAGIQKEAVFAHPSHPPFGRPRHPRQRDMKGSCNKTARL